MKKKIVVRLFFLSSLVAMMVSIDSCSSNCQTCAINAYENGSLTIPGTETEYCGAELAKQKLLHPDVTVGAVTTKFECH